MITLSALLLTGGESRRMGQDKSTIEWSGQPLWERQFELLRSLKPEKIFVSARTAPSWLPEGIELLLDDPPSRGPLSGLAKVFGAMRTTHLLALAVDMPFMTCEELRRLWDDAQKREGVVPVIRDRVEPLAAIYPAEVAPDFAAALTGTNFSLQTIIRKLAAERKLRLVTVPAEDENLYRSVNKPGDLQL